MPEMAAGRITWAIAPQRESVPRLSMSVESAAACCFNASGACAPASFESSDPNINASAVPTAAPAALAGRLEVPAACSMASMLEGMDWAPISTGAAAFPRAGVRALAAPTNGTRLAAASSVFTAISARFRAASMGSTEATADARFPAVSPKVCRGPGTVMALLIPSCPIRTNWSMSRAFRWRFSAPTACPMVSIPFAAIRAGAPARFTAACPRALKGRARFSAISWGVVMFYLPS